MSACHPPLLVFTNIERAEDQASCSTTRPYHCSGGQFGLLLSALAQQFQGRDHPPKCKEAIEVIDTNCLEPMAAGETYKNGCGAALQNIYKWKNGEKFCQLSIDMMTK